MKNRETTIMRRNVTWAMSTLSGVVLLMSYHTSTAGPAATAAGATTSSGTTSGTTSSGTTSSGTTSSGTTSSGSSATPSASATASTGATSGSTSSATSGSSTSKTYTGTSVNTQWGPVQVAITVSDGKIISSEAVVYPNENGKDVQINSYALPILNAEVVDAQSASIDAVSGATVTSVGYISSLQSALDKANL